MTYDWRTITFGQGNHDSREEGMCFMEAAAYSAGRPHSDRDPSICPVIGLFCRTWNDNMGPERTRVLMPFLWRVVGTKDCEVEVQRIEICKRVLRKYHLEEYNLIQEDGTTRDFVEVLACRHYDHDLLSKVLDEMISLTEIKEVVPGEMEVAL